MDDELRELIVKWEQASGNFQTENKPKIAIDKLYDFGVQHEEESTLNEIARRYLQKEHEKTHVLHEEMLTKAELAKQAEKMAASANPVNPTTLGKDQDVSVTQNWTSGEELEELANLKQNLYALESKFNAAYAQQQATESILKQIQNLKEKIDELSDSLSPNIYSSNK